MLIAFNLTMPGVNSWNGKWSGQDKVHVIVKTIGGRDPAKLPFKLGYYTYDFGDGWRAGIDVGQVDVPTARRLRKANAGFCGYDWMVDSIIADGAIYSELRPKPAAKDCGGKGV